MKTNKAKVQATLFQKKKNHSNNFSYFFIRQYDKMQSSTFMTRIVCERNTESENVTKT